MAYIRAMQPDPSPRHFNLLAWLRNSFLAGVALVLPFVVTAWVIWLVVSFVDHNVMPLLPRDLRDVAQTVPGSGVVIALVALTLVGAAAGNLFGRWIVSAADKAIANLPLVRSIYGGAKQVFKQVAAPERTSFKQAVLVEFPKPGVWAIGFITNEDTVEVARDTGEDLVAVYVPQAPIPTSGFLLYLSRATLKPLAITPEEALKRVISLGIIRDEAADAVLSRRITPP
jgi:uncharacterized membrane protein